MLFRSQLYPTNPVHFPKGPTKVSCVGIGIDHSKFAANRDPVSRYLNPIDIARVAAIIACVGLLYSPSVATIGLIAAYVAFLVGRQEAVVRFKEVIARPLGYWGLAFLGVVFIGMIYASVSWHDRWMDLYKWRTMLWMFVLLALFDEARWKERFLLTFLAATGVAVLASSFSLIAGIPIWRGAHEVLRNSGTQGMAFACAALVCVWIALEKKQVEIGRAHV